MRTPTTLRDYRERNVELKVALLAARQLLGRRLDLTGMDPKLLEFFRECDRLGVSGDGQ